MSCTTCHPRERLRPRVLGTLVAILVLVVQGTAFEGDQDDFHRQLDASEQRRLNLASHVLLTPNGGADLVQRSDAASLLLELDSRESIPPLNEAIRSGNAAMILAVIRANSDREHPEPDLLPALLAILPDAPDETIEPLGIMLAQYQTQDGSSLPSVATIALDQSREESHRVKAIQAMAAFRSHPEETIETLMVILDRHEDEPEPVTKATMESFSKLTVMPPNDDPAAWKNWWLQERTLPNEERLQRTIDAINRHAARLEHDLVQAQDIARQTSTRLLDAYQDLFPLLSLQQQQVKVLELLGDERSDVQAFAVDRVTVMLRDGHDTPEIQEAVAVLLADPDPIIRRKVAGLLGELGYEGVEGIVLQRLDTEQDTEVLTRELSYLGERQTVAAIPSARTLLENPQVREQAASTLRSILQGDPEITQEERNRIARAARENMDASTRTSIAPLLVLIGNEEDLEQLDTMLDDPDPLVRASIAEAFFQRGRHDSLLSRTDDEAIYPFALQAGQQRVVDLASLKMLLEMEPAEANATAWADAVVISGGRLPAAQVLEVDDLVGSIPHANDALRLELLNGAISSGTLSGDLQQKTLKRLVPMLLEQDDAPTALTHLQGLPEEQLDEELLAMKFMSAIRARLYDEAAQVDGSPGMWIKAYQDTLASRPESASDLRNEIVRRYNDVLTSEMRTQLGLADDPLVPRDDAAASAGNGDAEEGTSTP